MTDRIDAWVQLYGMAPGRWNEQATVSAWVYGSESNAGSPMQGRTRQMQIAASRPGALSACSRFSRSTSAAW
jgi:hypothetical protein